MNMYLINAFTQEEFKGNPAAIIILDDDKDEKWMASLAKQLNQPITTFALKKEDHFKLRWFTPTNEINLCGHGTLGASHILWSEGYCDPKNPITYETLSGRLLADRCNGKIKLTFPIIPATSIPILEGMNEVLNVPIKAMAWANNRYIVEVENASVVYEIVPNFERMKELDGAGVIVTTCMSEKYDIVSRYFAPKIGINEDSVTGSAHCALASYWKKHLKKNKWNAYQASERGGKLLLNVGADTVDIIGDCRTIAKGTIL